MWLPLHSWRTRLLIKWIYILVKLTGWLMFILDFVTYLTPHEGPTLCRARQWISGFFFEVGYTAIIKTLLVLRLRAFYQNDKWVTIILCLTTAIELLSTTYAYIMTGLNIHWYLRVPSPIPGCPLRAGNKMSYFRSPTVAWATRLASNSLELLLLLFGLQRTLSTSNEHFHKGWQRMKQLAPVLYVFYRDGTMFYLPVFGLSVFGFVATFDASITARLTCANWEAWLAIAYYIWNSPNPEHKKRRRQVHD